MESLVIDKNELLKKLDRIIEEAENIKAEISKDILLNEIAEYAEIIPETEETLKSKKSTLEHAVKEQEAYKEKENKKEYKDMYDPESHPDFSV